AAKQALSSLIRRTRQSLGSVRWQAGAGKRVIIGSTVHSHFARPPRRRGGQEPGNELSSAPLCIPHSLAPRNEALSAGRIVAFVHSAQSSLPQGDGAPGSQRGRGAQALS